MIKNKFQIVLCVLCFIYIKATFGGATMEQTIAAGKLVKDVCKPKFPKVTPEMADGIKDGIIPDDKDTKCYINCILEMMQMVKKGKFLYDSSLKQFEILLPDDLVEDYRNGAKICKDVAIGIKNNCDAAYTLLVCFKEQIPKFLFP